MFRAGGCVGRRHWDGSGVLLFEFSVGCSQTMEPAGRAARTHRDPIKHTLWHYPTSIHPEAVTQIKEAQKDVLD